MTEIREIKSSEWKDAMRLAWRVFLKFEAPEYRAEGVRNFYSFISDPVLEKMFRKGEYIAFGAFDNEKIVGILGIRDKSHISLLFVDTDYHKQGIASALISRVFDYLRMELGAQKATVNSSPYAVGFYHKMGFHDTDLEITKDGIRFTPMTCMLWE